MKIGKSVKVKQGVFLPDYDDLEIGGWQGRVVEIDNDLITFELDSITLGLLPEFYITDCFVDDTEFSLLCLSEDELETTNPRDTEKDVEIALRNINVKYSADEEEKRIHDILSSDDLEVNQENQEKYFAYLTENLKKPFKLTGSEDFDWEEPYLLGGWNKKEYKELKKERPSYTDTFEFLRLRDEIDHWKGIYAEVKRISDNKTFEIPLRDLKMVDNNNENFLLVSDYSSWMTNYQ